MIIPTVGDKHLFFISLFLLSLYIRYTPCPDAPAALNHTIIHRYCIGFRLNFFICLFFLFVNIICIFVTYISEEDIKGDAIKVRFCSVSKD